MISESKLAGRGLINSRKTRIAVVNTHPIQYFAPLYAYINTSPDIEVTALYLSDFSLRGAKDKGFGQVVKWDIDLLSGYPYHFVGKNARRLEPTGFYSMIVPEIWSALRRGGYDVLWLHGHGIAANVIALAAAKWMGMRVFMRSETHLLLRRMGLKAKVRRPVMSTLFSLCDAILAIGTANSEFYQAMGVPADKISLVPYTVDNERFMTRARMTPDERRAMRRRFGISDDRPAIIYVSKLMPRKHPDHLIKAAQRLAREGLSFDLVVAGSGEMGDELNRLIAIGGPPHVVKPGFINQMEMPALLSACDVFVLPSEDEPWGLIVNEAMCAGLPVVIAADVGSARDLVRHGENGFAFKAGDISALADHLQTLLLDPGMRVRMSQRSLQIIGEWNYESCLKGLQEAVGRTFREKNRVTMRT
jgi:glycosyltransferase involved in cell wall biosynthesis